MLPQVEDENSISINANSSANAGNSHTDENGIVTGTSSVQRAEEFEKDTKQSGSIEDNNESVLESDNGQTNSTGASRTGRAGTTEQKLYGDAELNKGLEAQAQDVEGA